MKINKTEIVVVKGSVLDQDVDCIVNAANVRMTSGGCLCGKIFKQSGIELDKHLAYLCPSAVQVSEVVWTPGFNLKQKNIFHVAGPMWQGGNFGEHQKLQQVYQNCLSVANSNEYKTIAIPSISTGIYNFPLDDASQIAIKETVKFLETHPDTSLEKIIFAMLKNNEFDYFSQSLQDYKESVKNK